MFGRIQEGLNLEEGAHYFVVPRVEVGRGGARTVLVADASAHLEYDRSMRRDELHVVAEIASSEDPRASRRHRIGKSSLVDADVRDVLILLTTRPVRRACGRVVPPLEDIEISSNANVARAEAEP